MNQFEFFQGSNLQAIKEDVNGWLKECADAVDIISWDWQRFDGVYTLTVFYSEIHRPETVGFQNQNTEICKPEA